MNGHFSEESLQHYSDLVAQSQLADFAEGETYDFTRCVRPNGTAYGTRGQCKKGTEQAKQAMAPTPRKPGPAGYEAASDKERGAALDKLIRKGAAGKPEAPSRRQAEVNARLKEVEEEQRKKKQQNSQTGPEGYKKASDKERGAALDKEMGDSLKWGAEREKPSANQAAVNARAKQLGF